MPKRWADPKDASCLFITSHAGIVGGGELWSCQIASIFDSLTDMRFLGRPPGRGFRKNHAFTDRFKHTGVGFKPDIFISCSHFVVPEPVGKERNILVVFFPNKDHKNAVARYDTIITLSEFSRRWIKKYWKRDSIVINPYVDHCVFRPGPEVSRCITVINVGRFFEEPDGHGKRQDVLIEAFAGLRKQVKDATMVLAGAVISPDDEKYLLKCKVLAEKLGVLDHISFEETPPLDRLVTLYQNSHFYWHANGYEQDDPFKTEHFGYVIAEAMACGCEPIIYKNGGYEEFNCPIWTGVGQLADITEEQLELHNIENWEQMWQDEALKFSRQTAEERIFEIIGR